ncbi:hypothetical protein GB937_000889 [Aspergillus fischeri]|nr:hypothetical protein GB937_000889 [Aspergillus fischeri]
MAFWATPTAPALSTRRGISIVKIAALPARTNSHRDPLYDTPVVMARRIHAVVDGEVPTNQVRPHGRILTGKGLGFAYGICLVFAVVDAHNAGVSACTCVLANGGVDKDLFRMVIGCSKRKIKSNV